MKIIKIVAVLVLFLVALALGSQNQELVTFNYLLAKGEFHLSTLLGVVFVVGFAVAWVIFASIQLKTQLQVRRLKKKLKKYEPAEAEKTAKPAI
ncbi:lipopolysaccharide assembly protein LapA domain-containing protein [Vibrio parahaemolyticus]|nr:lipopolysaccharide assembly protein LapA domain-containing protein [Vibrio parahaemolyticus]MDF4428034.1 lipopolysaccharide assembly protein LapA domain-containing protein [Vibrio parahaemolyticus]MDF4437221.1 lipopolysaccharide assembly protein LapA domain-containing protein [Vibrio parahaemolyticus]MDF4446515.1 lipopolysaccharide assembly protein LapA domain-containing protein [Vibrio parahaemolyticus]